jgi:lipopolysaccharide/colanic/teichoic acid biosynthesis glycosyltransferase
MTAAEYVGARVKCAFTSRPPNRLDDTANAALALAVLLFVLPLMLTLAALIYIDARGPVLFRHTRIGRNGKPFDCLKFRTMGLNSERLLAEMLACDAAAREEWERDFKLRNDPRVTPIGRFLRRSSLDELPQLVNILRGEMAFVGPRPIVAAEALKYGRRFQYYCSVKPGLTGLWQVNGRNDVTYSTRVAMDCLYVRRKSLMLDAYILTMTVPAVLARRGSY